MFCNCLFESSVQDPVNIRTKSVEIPLGQATRLYFTPTAVRTDQTGRDLPEERRKCRLETENKNLDIFRQYSREACVLECQIQQAYQACGCFPWDFPHRIQSEDFIFCDLMSNICFDSILKNASTALACDCPMDCNYVSYYYSIVRDQPFSRALY